MRWLALYLPQLSLEACRACAMVGADTDAPLALLDGHRIADADAAALRLGVQPGQKRATALALAPGLRLVQADAARDAQALTAVAHAALAFTPSVTLDGPCGVLLELQASLRLFGGLPRLVQRLRQALVPLGHRLQIAAAPTALGATLLACWRDDLGSDAALQASHVADCGALQTLLDAVPVALLAPPEQHQALQDMGLATLADLRALPRAGLARRFGPALLDALDRARGERPDPRTWVALPPVFDSRLELATRADRSDQLLHAAAVLLARLVVWARAQQARVAGFTLRMRHDMRRRDRDQAGHTDLAISLAGPSVDTAHLQLLLRERLTRLTLPAPTLELQLQCWQLVRGTPPSGELFASHRGETQGLTRLLERLRARLGEAQVQGLETAADHRPERATRATPVAGLPAHTAVSPAAPPTLHRPLWLWPEALPLAERAAQPWLDGMPLQLLVGPERIETGWWDGGAPTLRDYFIAQTGDGVLVWIYRARLPAAGEGWFLHGRFA